MLGPRNNFLIWDDAWMAVAKLFADKSKDPNTQVGACIVTSDNKLAGLGYNGFPRGCNTHLLPWDREGEPLDTKYMYVCHAEANAIDNGDHSKISGSRIYVTLFPCNECAKRIIQNGIKEVIYLSDKYHDSDVSVAARRMFELANIKTRKFKGQRKDIHINLEE